MYRSWQRYYQVEDAYRCGAHLVLGCSVAQAVIGH